MSINMNLTVKCKAEYLTINQWDRRQTCPAGGAQVISPDTTVEYCGHTVGGMVKVMHEGQMVVINPNATVELSA